MNPHSTSNTQGSPSKGRFSLLRFSTNLSSVLSSTTSKGLLQDTTPIKLHINNSNNSRNINNLYIQIQIQKGRAQIPLEMVKWTMIRDALRWVRLVSTSTNITRTNLIILSMIKWCSRLQIMTTYSSATIEMIGGTVEDRIPDQGWLKAPTFRIKDPEWSSLQTRHLVFQEFQCRKSSHR